MRCKEVFSILVLCFVVFGDISGLHIKIGKDGISKSIIAAATSSLKSGKHQVLKSIVIFTAGYTLFSPII